MPAARLLASLMLIAAAAGCGGSPAAPSPAPAFAALPAGAWQGSSSLRVCNGSATSLPEVCVATGSLPVTLRLQGSAESTSGELVWLGTRIPVSGRVDGRALRLSGRTASPAGAQLEVRDWETRFVSEHEMQGRFTVLATTADPSPDAPTMTLDVASLVRAGPA